MVSRILVVEDDFYLQRDLKEILTKQGYDVLTASSKQEGMYYVLGRSDIDLYLLDVWLPDGEGFELCTQIRKQNMHPILFLTACDEETAVVKGLDLGGDDYIFKPFRTAELLSRISANLRRQHMQTKVLQCNEITLDKAQGTVYLGNQELSLRPVEYRLLFILMQNAGRIVKRERLLKLIWDETENDVEDNTLSVHISRLRRKLGGLYIETIRGFGYRFTGEVRERMG